MVVVDMALALICFTAIGQQEPECHNALVGVSTPRGEYTLIQRLTSTPFYGGDVLQFTEDKKIVYAIHRVWLGHPNEQREHRLASSKPAARKMTKGCINVEPAVYEKLVACCSQDKLVIK